MRVGINGRMFLDNGLPQVPGQIHLPIPAAIAEVILYARSSRNVLVNRDLVLHPLRRVVPV